MSYIVYLITPNGMPRNHHALFVETNSVTGSDHIFQVTDNIQKGMAFEDKPGHSPDQQPTFHGKTFLGTKSFKDIFAWVFSHRRSNLMGRGGGIWTSQFVGVGSGLQRQSRIRLAQASLWLKKYYYRLFATTREES
ncbi:hypothetical protein I7I51_08886 [Histoplasma capsulatum]|uniref:Uncharacterized protein n=1 Tax=Ajellomyces capsulatus TaxID=5037 RepID=A0A8A1M0D7_AJECA|nr:hypothetical protein I7I51_08886 [Histoplasma capsulatum]